MPDMRRETVMSPDRSVSPVSFTQRMVSSEAFKILFRDGMALVEETAGYLDGPGRTESRALSRQNALAYASESMRLTTRLMQLTSWLLLQRAVNEGELTRDEAEKEHARLKVSQHDIASAPDMYSILPENLRLLVERSLRLQDRIMKIDAALKGAAPEAPEDRNPVAAQIGALRQALSALR